MRVLVVENYVGTPLGQVGPALAEAGAEIDLRAVWQGAALPESPAGYDGLVVLGGEQSAVDDADHPYLPHLAALTAAFGAEDKAVLGICLGAQIVARGAGAKNVLGRPVEFGWHPVTPTAAGRADPVIAALGDGGPIFHWHLDTFSLPEGALHLATSAMTPNQAFRMGRASYAIQFHLEADRALVARWSRDFAEVIARETPDWPSRHAQEAATFGPPADATGAALARAWVSLVR